MFDAMYYYYYYYFHLNLFIFFLCSLSTFLGSQFSFFAIRWVSVSVRLVSEKIWLGVNICCHLSHFLNGSILAHLKRTHKIKEVYAAETDVHHSIKSRMKIKSNMPSEDRGTTGWIKRIYIKKSAMAHLCHSQLTTESTTTNDKKDVCVCKR